MNGNGERSVLELTMMHLWKRRPLQMETLTFKVFKTLSKSGQPVKNALKSVSKSQNQKNPKELKKNGAEKKCRSLLIFLTSTNRSTGPHPIDRLVNVVNDIDFPTFVHFFILRSSPCHFQFKSPIFLCPMLKEFLFLVKI